MRNRQLWVGGFALIVGIIFILISIIPFLVERSIEKFVPIGIGTALVFAGLALLASDEEDDGKNYYNEFDEEVRPTERRQIEIVGQPAAIFIFRPAGKASGYDWPDYRMN